MLEKIKFISYKCFEGFLALVLKPLSYVIPRDPKHLAFGAWLGHNYSDNAKHLALYLLEHTDYSLTWIGLPKVEQFLPKHPRLTFARFGSLKATWHLLRAKFWFFTHTPFYDLSELPVLGNGIAISLCHGIPFKRVGMDCSDYVPQKPSFMRLIWGWLMKLPPHYIVIANDEMGAGAIRGYPGLYSPDGILPFGSTRNDFLINNRNNVALIAKTKGRYAQLLNFPSSKKIILYLPTFRHATDEAFCFCVLAGEKQQTVSDILDRNDAVLIEKLHPSIIEKHPSVKRTANTISIDAQQARATDLQELLLVADILICDYSGALIDFGHLKRPIIHYAYDLERYTSADSGLLYDFTEVRGGPIVKTFSELMQALDDNLKSPVFNPGPKFSQLVEYETGHACEQLLQFIQKQEK